MRAIAGVSYAFVVIALGCSQDAALSSRAPGSTAPTDAGIAKQDSAPPSDTLEIEPESRRVKTNTGTEPKFVFRLGVKYGASEQYHALLSERARFVAADGSVTTATIATLEVKYGEPGLGHRVSLSPAAKLHPATWYRLVIQEDSKLVVRAVTGSGASSNPWDLAFFTSSAPHLTSAEWSPKNSSVLRLEFSEPLELSTIAVGKLASQGGSSISKCILIGAACAPAATTVASDVAVVQLTKALSANQPAAVLLDNGVMGAGQSVADGAKTAAYDTESTSAGLVTTIGPSEWTECQAQNAKCWAWAGNAVQ